MGLSQTSTEQYSRPSNLLRDDVIRVPSATRSGLLHSVSVSVLLGATTGCSCEAGQRNLYCAHRKEVDANEGAWGFSRCVLDGTLMRLDVWNTRSGAVRVWRCSQSDEHSSHEAGTAILFRRAVS